MTLLAIDPGRSVKEASIGYCVFNSDGTERERGSLTWDELFSPSKRYSPGQPFPSGLYISLIQNSFDEVVIENFINNTRSRGGQTNGTSEVIGAVEVLCQIAEVPFTRQPNTILPVAKLHAGYEQKLKHLPHQDAAFLHGYYYLVEKGLLHPKGLASTL